ncbi:asparagine synthase-related protein [Streptomyces sp. MP131-18]|uniref:asparagine synthase-related protein n=1 Tax=Streptomyces sp. MP131-18 TaxID=1857892 RepID=UPI00097C2B15|nr:asparagine synthase-related protein [Streptomyces sp. MP131-18]ONK13349.1 Asparagine synthase (glutamine-hydrolyzing) [Streptomyces sp. MP131-18]
MRWLVGWAGAAASAARDIQPLGAHLLWEGPDPLWAVGDWRPDEIRLVYADGDTHLAVFGYCGADDETLRRSLVSARAGALRQLTTWPGSYTAVARFGRRTVIPADLAGTRPVFHTAWAGGTAYATAALPLADLTEAQLDVAHLAAQLACPEAPEAVGDGTPYRGVRRVPPGHALRLREGGSRDVLGYEPTAPLVVAAPPVEREAAVAGVRDALVEAVRTRLAAPRHAPARDAGPVPGMGPADRRAARVGPEPAPGVGADLSGGSASATLALLAAGLPGMPGTVYGTGATLAGERLLAVTFNDLTAAGTAAGGAGAAELDRARIIAENPRLHHVVVAAGEEALPYAELENGPLTDEPGPALVTAARHRHRLAAGSADHLTGHGARQVLDAHPARLADLLLDRRRRHLLRPVTALAKASGGGSRAMRVPFTVYRAARRLARTSYPEGLAGAAVLLRSQLDETAPTDGALGASLAALSWCRPGPAARWLTGEALAEVSIRLEAVAARPRGGATTGRPGEQLARAVLARHAADHRVFEQAAEVRHQRLHAPFYDNQVVRACQALPESLRVQPGARAEVLRTVLDGAGVRGLPPGWGATTHGSHTDSVRSGLRAYVSDIVGLFDAPLLADAGLIEARVVRKAVRAAAQGELLPLDGLAELVSTEIWLRRLLTRRGSCWTAEGNRDPRAVTSGVSL